MGIVGLQWALVVGFFKVGLGRIGVDDGSWWGEVGFTGWNGSWWDGSG